MNTQPDALQCTQCRSDLKVHRLLQTCREKINTPKQNTSKENYLDIICQLLPTIFFLSCAVFGVYVGMRVLTFLHQFPLSNTTVSLPISNHSVTKIENQ